MRILHLNDVASVGSNLVLGLNGIGIEADLLPIAKASTIGPGYKRYLLPFYKLSDALKLKRVLEKGRYNILHVHYATHALLPLLAGIPFYLHAHGTDIRRDLHRPGLGWVVKRALRTAKAVFYVTPDMRTLIEPYRPDAIFLPNPIDTNTFSTEGLRWPVVPRIFCISKLDRLKGVEEALQAVELVWKANPSVEVMMFGFGNAPQLGDAFMRKYGSDARLTLIGRTPHDQMPALIHSASVILGHQSNEHRAISCSELEAMACGKPVVCRFGHPGAYTVFPPLLVSNNAEEACDQLISLLDSPEQSETIGLNGRRWVETYHEKTAIAQRLAHIYRERL